VGPILIGLAIVLSPSAFLLLWGYLVAHARNHNPEWEAEENRRNAEEAEALRLMQLRKAR
jgi:hypothetical protein